MSHQPTGIDASQPHVVGAAPGSSLLQLLTAAAAGSPPPADGRIVVDPRPSGPAAAVLAFTAHHVIVADVPIPWVAQRLPAGDLSAPMGPAFLLALAERLGAPLGTHDLVLAAPAGRASPGVGLQPAETGESRRLCRARRYRDGVQVWSTPGGEGLLILGRGLAGRTEASVEVAAHARGQGLGRRLAAAARHHADPGEPVFMQVAPGNVASVRAVLAAGYQPIGAEVLLPLR